VIRSSSTVPKGPEAEQIRSGGCNCGAVRFQVPGEPERVLLCHCLTCRKETGSPFLAAAVWPKSRFSVTGETRSWHGRHFCPSCGSRVFHEGDHEVEVLIGSFDDAPSAFVPAQEIWIGRRERWLEPVAGAAQHDRDPP
jgi:hypothetical protein